MYINNKIYSEFKEMMRLTPIASETVNQLQK